MTILLSALSMASVHVTQCAEHGTKVKESVREVCVKVLPDTLASMVLYTLYRGRGCSKEGCVVKLRRGDHTKTCFGSYCPPASRISRQP